MKSNQFTPGPWKVQKHNSDKQQTAFYINGRYFPRPEAEANARLISAAPDLVEVLELIESYWSQGQESEEQEAVLYKEICLVLEKATGGPNEE